jgi:hypothetical protein
MHGQTNNKLLICFFRTLYVHIYLFKHVCFIIKKNTKFCAALGYYIAYSGSPYRRFGITYRSHFKGQELHEKPHFFRKLSCIKSCINLRSTEQQQ